MFAELAFVTWPIVAYSDAWSPSSRKTGFQVTCLLFLAWESNLLKTRLLRRSSRWKRFPLMRWLSIRIHTTGKRITEKQLQLSLMVIAVGTKYSGT
jgi:hypothetical protein